MIAWHYITVLLTDTKVIIANQLIQFKLLFLLYVAISVGMLLQNSTIDGVLNHQACINEVKISGYTLLACTCKSVVAAERQHYICISPCLTRVCTVSLTFDPNL